LAVPETNERCRRQETEDSLGQDVDRPAERFPVLSEDGFLKGLTFKLADATERILAQELQERVYRQDIGHVPRDAFDDAAHFFLVLNEGGEAVAAFRLIGPEQRPFDLDRLMDLNAIVPPGRRPAIVGRLCIRHDFRTVSRTMMLPLGMLKLACLYSTKHDISDLLLYTYPHLLRFYRGAFFRALDLTVEHPDWGRVHVMHLDLVALAQRYAASDTPLARFLFQRDLPNFLV
jgi:hypothetical protein